MANYSVKKLPKNAFELTVTVPWKTVQNEYDKAFEAALKDLEIQGFRKGNVPKEVAKKHIPSESLYQVALQNLLPDTYAEIVKKEDLKPVLSPKIELLKAKENEDWQLKITLAQRPTVQLGDYKKIIKEAKSSQKAQDIWVPGKEKDKVKDEQNKQKLLNEVLSALVKKVPVEIADLILEEELNARLSQLLDDAQKLGLTMENYLKSRGTTIEALRESYRKEIEMTHQLEFILAAIADAAELKVEEAELEAIFNKITDIKEREEAQKNAYFYASILRKQKTLDFLMSL